LISCTGLHVLAWKVGGVSVAQELSRADVVVAAIGKPEFVKAEWIKPGAVVIDVGINVVKDPRAKSGQGVSWCVQLCGHR
jgi:5,10-methylene-tetrahydrofolate dehydrogenase/methenyl tetrahydrofolate cyclohydrolase